MELKEQKNGIEERMASTLDVMEKHSHSEDEMTYEEAQRCYLTDIEALKGIEELEYNRQIHQLKLEEEQRKQKEESSLFKKIWPIFLDVANMSVKVAGAIAVPLTIANLSYAKEEDMKLKNGSVWGLLGKKFDK